SHVAYLHRLALVGEDRVARDDEETRDLRERGDHVLGHAVAEVLLRRILAEVGKRQDGHRRLVGQREACGFGGSGPPPPTPADTGQQRRGGRRDGDRGRPGALGARRGSRRRARIEPQTVYADRPRDVLDGVLADELAGERELALDLVIGRARETDAAGLGEA